MNETIIELREASNEGRLYYKTYPGNKHNLLIVQSLQPRQMAYCVNIEAGSLLLYFDAQRRLQDIELGIRRNYWQKTLSLSEPGAVESADVFLRGVTSFHGKWKHPWVHKRSGRTIRVHEFDHKVSALSNPEFTSVQILIGSPEISAQWILLSENCWAQIHENRLKGFFVKLSD